MGEKKGKWRLTVRTEFSSAHQLRHYEGKCEQIHGHNFGVEVCVVGDTLTEETQLLLDFKILKGFVKEVIEQLDHKHLNDIAYFKENNPSSENISRFIYKELEKHLQGFAAGVDEVTVSEKAIQSATYFEE